MSNVVQFPGKHKSETQADNVIDISDLLDPADIDRHIIENAVSSILMSLEEDGIDTDHPAMEDMIADAYVLVANTLKKVR